MNGVFSVVIVRLVGVVGTFLERLRGLNRGEVAVMERTGTDAQEGPHVRVIQDGLPDVGALRVDQLLTSPHFGLESAYDPEVDELMTRYYQLLAKPNPTDE